MVLAGHPRLKNDLRRPAREETGARTTVFELEGIQGHQRRYITWLLEQCAPAVDPTDILTPEALELLAERLMTPLQIEHYLTRVLEQAYRFGEKPVTPAIVHDPGAGPACSGAHVDALRVPRQRAGGVAQYPPGRSPRVSPRPTAAGADGRVAQPAVGAGIPLSDRSAVAGKNVAG